MPPAGIDMPPTATAQPETFLRIPQKVRALRLNFRTSTTNSPDTFFDFGKEVGSYRKEIDRQLTVHCPATAQPLPAIASHCQPLPATAQPLTVQNIPPILPKSLDPSSKFLDPNHQFHQTFFRVWKTSWRAIDRKLTDTDRH